MRMRKAVASGLTALLATAALAGCGDAPESSASGGDGGEETTAALDFLPCMVSDAGGFDDKSFNQLGLEGLEQAADELGVEFNAVQSDSETDYAPNLESLVDQGCNLIITVGFALAAATGESAAANPDIEYVSIDDAVATTTTSTARPTPPNIKPIALRHRPGGVPRRLRGGRLLEDRRRRHLRRHELPDRLHLHGRLQAGRRVPQHREGHGRPGPRLGRHRTASSPVASRPTTRPRNTAQGSSTRTSTCSCPSAARSTRAPPRPSATPAVRSR